MESLISKIEEDHPAMLCYAIVQIHSSGPFKAKAFLLLLKPLILDFEANTMTFQKYGAFY